MATLLARRQRPPAKRPRSTRPTGSTALVASAQQVSTKNAAELRRLEQPWQQTALAYYDQLGEVHFASSFYARPVSRIRLFPAVKKPDGEIEETEDPTAKALLDRIQDPGGGYRGLLTAYAQLDFVIGESRLVWTAETDDEAEKWEILSPLELRIEGDDRFRRFAAPGAKADVLTGAPDDDFEPVPGDARVYRLWRRHPAWSGLADSPMRGTLDICKELHTLTKTINARALSRLAANGILWIPSEISDDLAAAFPVPPGTVGDENPAEDMFIEELTAHLMASIKDSEDAAAVAPLVVRVKGEHIAQIVHMLFRNPEEAFPEIALRNEAITRLGISWDMPPQGLKGMEGTNHWTSALVRDDMWQTHQAPCAQRFCDNVSAAYYRPACRDEGLADWKDRLIGFDAADVTTNPDKSKDADEAYDRRAIGKAALREAKGFTDDDAPSEEELEEMLTVALREVITLDGAVIKLDRPPMPALNPGEPVDPAGEDTPRTELPSTDDDEPDVTTASGSLARVLGAAEMAVQNAREVAGKRLVAHAKGRCPECAEQVRTVPSALVASALGEDTLAEIAAPAAETLVAGACGSFVSTLERWGVGHQQALALGEMLELHAARTLLDERPAAVPVGFAGFVSRLEVAR